MLRTLTFLVALSTLILLQCDGSTTVPATSLTVAAAANLVGVFDEIAGQFTENSGTKVVLSYGSTAQLAQQIENGAPFDLFAAADTEHVDSLIEKGRILPASKRVYARGRLVLWVPQDSPVTSLQDLTAPEIRFVAIAKPDFAPYGLAAVEALKTAGLWPAVEPKVVYTQNVLTARQLVDSGNADAGLVALSLVNQASGKWLEVDPSLFPPIEQALGIVTDSKAQNEAQAFADFILSPTGQTILERHGYQPNQKSAPSENNK